MWLYVPLQLLMLLHSPKSKSALDGLRAAALSSSFLAGFVSSFYYAVCLARTQRGPKIFLAKDNNTADVGLWPLCASWVPDVWVVHFLGETRPATGDRLLCGIPGSRHTASTDL